MKQLVVLNGELKNLNELQLRHFMNGFSFGAGLFETLLVASGQPLLLDQHLTRLIASLDQFPNHLVAPPRALLTATAVRTMLEKAFRADPGMGPRFTGVAKMVTSDGQLLILFRDLPPNHRNRLTEGIQLNHTQNHVYRKGDVTLNHKLLSYFRQFRYLKQPILFINEYDELCETPTANIFLEEDGQLITPPLEAPCLPGTVRAALLADAKHELPIREAPLRLAELDRVQGGFITNSVSIAIPITTLLGKTLTTSRSWAAKVRNFIKARYLEYDS